ncbi:MAG: nitroreductase [Steroidobacteraceae bacterium]
MSELVALLARRSVPARYLGGPGPGEAQIEAALAAAGRAPDHGQLCPWRFRRVQGAALPRFAELLVSCALQRDPHTPPEQLEKFRLPASRAPLALIVSAQLRVHKVPELEQLLATGAAVMNVLNAFHLQGFGAIWLTGANAYDPGVAAALGLGPQEKLLGFVYVGSPGADAPRSPPRPELGRYTRSWPG